MAFFNILSHPYRIGQQDPLYGGGGAQGGATSQTDREKAEEAKAAAKLVEQEKEGELAGTLNGLQQEDLTAEEFEAAIDGLKTTYGDEYVDKEILNYATVNKIFTFAGVGDKTSNIGEYVDDKGLSEAVIEQSKKERYKTDEFRAKYLESKNAAADAVSVGGEVDSLDKDASKEERVTLTQQTYQCYLLHNIEAFAEFHRNQFNFRMTDESEASSPAPFTIEGSGDQRILLVDDSHPDGAFFATNKMTSLGKTKGISDVRPHEIAQLIPKLRIYKVFRDQGEEVAKVELNFDNYTDTSFLEGPRDPAGGFAKGAGSGIKSFNWSFVGGDPFTATRDLTATIKLYFQDFQDLIKVRKGVNLFFPDAASKNYRYLDLVLQPDCRDKKTTTAQLEEEARAENLGYDVYHPECYEIAVEVGYADVSMVSSSDMSASTKEAIKKQSDTIYLTMTEHNFDINQDGTFELTINYRARLSSFLGDKGMNVLLPGGGYAMETEGVNGEGTLEWSLSQLDEEIKSERKKAKDGTTERNEFLKDLETVREIVISKSTISLHSGIMKSLFKNRMVYQTTISHQDFNKFSFFGQIDRTNKDSIYVTNWDEDTDSGIILGIDRVTGLSVQDGFYHCPEGTDASGNPTPIQIATTSDASSFTAVNPAESQKKRIGEVLDSHKIFFTTLGDVIGVITDHVLGETSILPKGKFKHESMKDFVKSLPSGDNDARTYGQNARDRLKSLFRPTSVSDKQLVEIGKGFEEGLGADTADDTVQVPLNGTQAKLMERFRVVLGTLAYRSTVDDQVHSINLAHMPISLESLQTFFIENVIMTNRTFYSYQDFVKDLLNDIILKNMRRECFGGYFENAVKAGISLLKAQGVVEDNVYLEPITNREDENIYGPRDFNLTYNVLKMKNATESNPIFTNIESKNVKNYDYMLFSAYSTKGFAGALTGVESTDRNLGIPHFRFGQTTGFLKSANFSKTPLEYAAEERYVREGSANMLNQLAGRYEMQLNMVGNSIFHPGQYVFFDPIAMGVGRPNENDGGEARSYANRMGLGGYHIITEVGNSISVGKFETTIKALWDTSGKPTGEEKE